MFCHTYLVSCLMCHPIYIGRRPSQKIGLCIGALKEHVSVFSFLQHLIGLVLFYLHKISKLADPQMQSSKNMKQESFDGL